LGIGLRGFDIADDGRGGLGVAAAEVDVIGMVLCELEDRFFSETGGSCIVGEF